jgi:hypothetical protein
MTSAATAAIANVNDAPSGTVTVDGTATEDQTLTANTSTVADADGLGSFSYQWQRSTNGGGSWSNVGANAATYTLGDADVDAIVRVVVSYTDGQGTAESLTSAATATIANVNDAPTGSVTIDGTATEDQTLTANTSTVADADGLGTFGYQWLRDGQAIVGAAAATYTAGDADVGATIGVRVTYTDAQGGSEVLAAAAVGPVANVDDAPTGGPAIVGVAVEDEVLSVDTSSIADADGLGPFSLQWLRDGVAIDGATAGSYRLGDADSGATLSVRVDYTDARGSAATLTSAATATVADVNDAPVITSGGGGTTAEVSLPEMGVGVTTVTSTDVDGGAPSYAIVGGADAAQFAIDAVSGQLRFVAAPDFDAPGDADADNVYEVSIEVGDGRGGVDRQALAVRVGDVDEAPVWPAFGRQPVAENSTTVTALTATDPEGAPLIWSIAGGADADRFVIDAATGTLRFAARPDFEQPADHDGDNVYRLDVGVADPAGGTAVQSIEIEVTGVAEAPRLELPARVTVSLAAAPGQWVSDAVASDADAADTLRFALVEDAGGVYAKYAIDAASGRIVTAIDGGAATASEDVLRVRVTDASGLTDERTLIVQRVDDAPPEIVLAPIDFAAPELEDPPEVVIAAVPATAPAEEVPAARPLLRSGPVVQPAPRPEWLAPIDPSMEPDDRRRSLLIVRASTFEDQAWNWPAWAVAWGAMPTLGGSSAVDLGSVFETSLQREESAQLALLALRGSFLPATDEGSGQWAEDGDMLPTLEKVLTDPVNVAGASVTAGFVWWLTRSGGAIASVLMGVPAWRHVDLLPVLASDDDDEEADSDGDDTTPGRSRARSAAKGSDGAESIFEREDRFSADWGDSK